MSSCLMGLECYHDTQIELSVRQAHARREIRDETGVSQIRDGRTLNPAHSTQEL